MENIKIGRRHNMMTPTEKDKKMQTVLLLNKRKTLEKFKFVLKKIKIFKCALNRDVCVIFYI